MDQAILKKWIFLVQSVFFFSGVVFAETKTLPKAAEVASSVLSGKKHVLVLSDSHGLGPYGQLLEQALWKEPNTELYFYALGGSNPEWWFSQRKTPRGYVFFSSDGKDPIPHSEIPEKPVQAPSVEKLLSELSEKIEGTSDHIIVILIQGTNQAGALSKYSDWFKQLIVSIYKTKNASCLWVAPPMIRVRTRESADHIFDSMFDAMVGASKEVTNEHQMCSVVNSLKYTEYPKIVGDGWHYKLDEGGFKAVDLWFKKTFEKYKKILQQIEIESLKKRSLERSSFLKIKKTFQFLTKNKQS